jgi:hypothetical protein
MYACRLLSQATRSNDDGDDDVGDGGDGPVVRLSLHCNRTDHHIELAQEY